MKKKRALYITDYCLTPYENIPKSGILCEGERIIGIGGASAFARESGLEVIELPDCYAVPGFIDSHIHGAGGFDSSSAENDVTIDEMCKTLASHGVTSFVPTLVSAPLPTMLSVVDQLASTIDKDHPGAQPCGIHMEGPFINPRKHGSQIKDDILPIDLGAAKEIIQAGKGRIRIFTIAPELENAIELIELLKENDILASMGHSVADEDTVKRAVDAGATRCTHLYNGMPPLHQRNVALTAVALTDDRIAIELILDGAHLHPRMVDLACRSKPKDKLIGVSDAIQGAGLRDGFYHIGTAEINVINGRSTTPDGTLAGTTMTLEKGWHHLVTYSHMKNTDAAACFTINPARDLGLVNRGELKPGRRADISFFCKENNRTRLTVSKGKIVYDNEGFLASR